MSSLFKMTNRASPYVRTISISNLLFENGKAATYSISVEGSIGYIKLQNNKTNMIN